MGDQYKLIPVEQEGTDPYQLLFDVGTVTYSTTDSQATYRTSLTHITYGFVNLTGTTSHATDATVADGAVSVPLGAVSSGAITLTRGSSGTTGAKYAVLLIGYKYDTN